MQKDSQEQKQAIFILSMMVKFSYLLIGCFLINLLCPENIYAGSKILKGRHLITPKYFDSLRDDYTKCSTMNKGTEFEISKNKQMYELVVKEIEKIGDAFELDFRGVIKERKGPIDLEAKLIDLNKDGIDEAIVFVSDRLVKGGPGNSVFFVLEQKKKKNITTWRIIAALEGCVLNFDKHRTNGYLNILTYWHDSADSGPIYRYRMQKGRYIETDVTKSWNNVIKSIEACY